jgi:recombinational DNA repair protein (RecF pathway)
MMKLQGRQRGLARGFRKKKKQNKSFNPDF